VAGGVPPVMRRRSPFTLSPYQLNQCYEGWYGTAKILRPGSDVNARRGRLAYRAEQQRHGTQKEGSSTPAMVRRQPAAPLGNPPVVPGARQTSTRLISFATPRRHERTVPTQTGNNPLRAVKRKPQRCRPI